MKRAIIIIALLIILKIILPIKPYIELNHLNIIKKITITCDKEYKIEYIEIVPKKEDEGIEYEYKKYQVKSKSLEQGIKNIEKDKNIYKKKAKIIVNCKNKKEIEQKIKEDNLFYFLFPILSSLSKFALLPFAAAPRTKVIVPPTKAPAIAPAPKIAKPETCTAGLEASPNPIATF